MRRPRHFLDSQNGAIAAEFAMIVPVMVLLIFAIIHMGLLLYTSTRLHWAVEDAARCASVRSDCKTDGATNEASTEAWASGMYSGMATATFAWSAQACGNQVTGTATYRFNAVFFQRDVPLTATACFP